MNRTRVLDLALGVPVAILISPIVAAIGVAIIVTSGRPAFLVQTRVGANEKPFWCVKFRTMRVGVPVIAKHLFVPTPDSYTRLGPFLRRSSLDELPQIINVLRGEMSLVGPRPALPSQIDLLVLRRKHRVTELRPGITGLAQVEGRESLTMATKVRFEALYRRRRGLAMDLWIIARTARALISGRGAY